MPRLCSKPPAAITLGLSGHPHAWLWHRNRPFLTGAAFVAGILEAFLPVLLVAIAVYSAVKPNMNDIDKAERLSPFAFGLMIVPMIGFYDGLFGPGIGSFFKLAFMTLAGFGLLEATAPTKRLNFASSVGGFTAFAAVGVIVWKIGIVMGLTQFVGARVGASLAMSSGARLIKPLLVFVCIALAILLLADPANPLRHLIG